MERDFAPLGGTVHHGNDVANFRRLERGTLDARFLDQACGIAQTAKFKPAAHAPELANLFRELLLALDPDAVGRGREGGDSRLPQRRGGVPAQHLAQRVELQHSGAVLGQRIGRQRHGPHTFISQGQG